MSKTKFMLIIGGGLILLVILLVLVLNALFGGAGQESYTLTMWVPYFQTFGLTAQNYESAFNNFEEKNPNVKIELREVPFSDYESQLIRALAIGEGPDIFLMHNTWLPKHQDIMAPLPASLEDDNGDPLFTFRRFTETFVDATVFDLTKNEQIYSIPLYVDSLGLYYNRNYFNTYGVASPPTTWQEFINVVGRITQIDPQNRILLSAAAFGGSAYNVNRATDILMMLMLQNGVPMVNDERTSARFRTLNGYNEANSALLFYTEFADQSVPDRYTWNLSQDYSIDAFATGKTAMMINYSHHIPTIEAINPRLEFGIAPVPQNSSQLVTLANYWSPAVAAQSNHTEGAWRFLVDFATTGSVVDFLNLSQRPAARKDLISEQKNEPRIGVFAEQSLYSRSWYQQDNVEIEHIFNEMIDTVLRGGSVPDAVKAAETNISALMRR